MMILLLINKFCLLLNNISALFLLFVLIFTVKFHKYLAHVNVNLGLDSLFKLFAACLFRFFHVSLLNFLHFILAVLRVILLLLTFFVQTLAIFVLAD